MFIPASCGRLRFEENSCFLEHRSTSNHILRTRLVMARLDDTIGTTGDAAAFLINQLGLEDGAQVFIDGFLVGDQPDLELAVRGVTMASTHRGTLIYSGSQSLLQKSVGTRLLRRFGDPLLATQLLMNCGKQSGFPIEVTGTETISSNGVPSIEINTVTGC